MKGSTTQQLIDNHGADFLRTLMSLGSSSESELVDEIERRLRRDGFVKDDKGIWCELMLDNESLRVGGLKSC